MEKIAIKLITYYQLFSRTLLRYNTTPLFFSSHCRFYPTCSDYTIWAIGKYGFWKGAKSGLIRILWCNPFTNH